MKNVLNKLTAGLSVLPVLVLPSAVHAQLSNALTGGTTGIQTTQAGSTKPLTTLIANLVNVVLGVMGIIFVVLIVYAGILYMQAGSNPDNAKKAKSLIINAVIGLVIVVAAYAIANFIIQQLVSAT